MRIISGTYKGRPLKSPKSENIRPTGDKTKQALFTKLHFFVEGAVVLDLFCGSGSLGIEAISNGAGFVYFVDKDKRSIALTKENLKGIDGNYKLINADCLTALNIIEKKVDLILIDPPYASGLYDNVLKTIKEKDILNDDGIIVCEHPNEMEISSDFEIFDQKRYGTVALSYLKK